MSEASPSPIPLAAARLSTPPRAEVDCCALQPARDIYFNASAASEAEKTVVAPHFRADSSIKSKSEPVAPDIAATSEIIEV